jgi:uncharacterized protein (TIGR03435 family)
MKTCCFMIGAFLLSQNYWLVWAQGLQERASFEVASVKAVPASVSQSPMAKMIETMQDAYPLGFIPMSGPNVRIRSLSLTSIVALALRVRRRDVVAPGWMSDQFFDIDASPARDAPAGAIGQMLPSLLVERFGLQYHPETRSEKGYALVVDGVLRIKPTAQGPDGPGESVAAMKSAADGPPMPPKESAALNLARAAQKQSTERTSSSSFTLKDSTLLKLADALAREVKAPVADMTGLTGKYDFSLAFSTSAEGGEFDSLDGSLTRSMKELGLRLDRRMVPRAVIVIDKIAKNPTAN